MQMKEINPKLERLEPKARQSDGLGSNVVTAEMKSFSISHKRSSPKAKSAPKDTLFSTGQNNHLIFTVRLMLAIKQ